MLLIVASITVQGTQEKPAWFPRANERLNVKEAQKSNAVKTAWTFSSVT
jgi:hypothetical protein